MAPIAFPSPSIPEDPRLARLIGLYPQRQEGRWMQRVKVLGGVLSGAQWRALGAVAARHTPETPLHLTTRQDVELHDLTAGTVPAVQRELAQAGLTGLGACGDAFRNVTVCPDSGVRPGSVDLAPLARAIRDEIESVEWAYALPRKFKAALCCGSSCGRAWINDLGLVAEEQDGRWGFQVVAAGSLGARPATGMAIGRIEAGEAAPMAVAALRAFAAHGDRTNRARARLRHVRQRLGDQAFAALLWEQFRAVRSERVWPEVEMRPRSDGLGEVAALTFPDGDLGPQAAEALGRLADRADLAVRVGYDHRVLLFAGDAAGLRLALEGEPALAEAARPQASVVACPGKRWCGRALVHTCEIAGRIRWELGRVLPAGATVCVSGCPNGCSHSGVADVGLVGCVAGRDGRRVEAFDVLAGGGMGRDDRLATPVARRLPGDEALSAVEKHLRAWAVGRSEREP